MKACIIKVKNKVTEKQIEEIKELIKDIPGAQIIVEDEK